MGVLTCHIECTGGFCGGGGTPVPLKISKNRQDLPPTPLESISLPAHVRGWDTCPIKNFEKPVRPPSYPTRIHLIACSCVAWYNLAISGSSHEHWPKSEYETK